MLDPNVVGEFDAGGRIPGAPTSALTGAHLVATTLLHALGGSSAHFRIINVNAQPGVVVDLAGQTMAVITLETDQHHVHAIRAIGNSDKLVHLNAQ